MSPSAGGGAPAGLSRTGLAGTRSTASRALWLGIVFAFSHTTFHALGADPVLFRTAPGRFEVAALDGAAASAVTAMADAAWHLLAAPLGLPDAFSSPVLVRVIPAADWGERAPFRVVVEAGGIVSVRLRWEPVPDVWTLRRGLVQGLLMRLAIAQHGVNPRLAAPLWLEHACVGWWHSRLDAANLDALKQETASIVPPQLGELLTWSRGFTEPRSYRVGSEWLLAFLQAESAAGEWPVFLSRLLAGGEPLPALAASFPGRFSDELERELWWQTGWHHLRSAHGLPVLGAAASRLALEALARFVVAIDAERDAVAPLHEVLAHAGEVWLDLELQRRLAEVNRLLPALHPFYRNAGIALAAVFGARSIPARQEEVCRAFERDWRDALELDAAARAALDALQQRLQPRAGL